LDDVIYKVALSCVNLKVITKIGNGYRSHVQLIPPGMVGFVLLHNALIPQTPKQYLRTLMKAVIIEFLFSKARLVNRVAMKKQITSHQLFCSVTYTGYLVPEKSSFL
jgi:hypothetical protein